jgi:orotate phosphoribosyltransferase
LENQIEAELRARQRGVVVENQVNKGENIIKVVEVRRNNGCKVLGVVTIFDYAFPATRKKLEEMDITLTPLTDFETVLRHAAAMEMIDEDQRKSIAKWQSNPAKWKK